MTAKFRNLNNLSQFGAEGFHMKDSVLKAFIPFTTPFEVYTPYMYTDNKGFVTTGIGDLMEDLSTHQPTAEVFSLPWMNRDGSPATHEEILSEWNLVKTSFPGVQSTGDAAITQLRLSRQAVDALVYRKLASTEADLMRHYASWSEWPADAQLGTLSMAWAMGTGFSNPASNPGIYFKSFSEAVNQEDFATAAPQSHCRNCDPKRNTANLIMFQNAAKVVRLGLGRETLYYPSAPPDSAPSGGKVVAVAVALLAAAGTAALYKDEIIEGGRKVIASVSQPANSVLETKKT
jgi:hypothetical protein